MYSPMLFKEAGPSLRSGCPLANDLVIQAEDLGRASVMREVVGPALTDLLTPLYDVELSEDEQSVLENIHSVPEPESFYKNIEAIITNRLDLIKQGYQPKIYQKLIALTHARPDALYGEHSITEGVLSGIAVPLTIAAQIYAIEDKNHDLSDAHTTFHPDNSVPLEGLVEIMKRPEFDSMLLQLTKGPNGFLGGASTELELTDSFFSFKDASDGHLKFKDAYEVEGDKVIGLSDKYHLAANTRRMFLKDGGEVDYETGKFTGYKESSGCPVRHSFKGESNELQEPLVITAKSFVVSALKSIQ